MFGTPPDREWAQSEAAKPISEITAGNLDRARYDASYRISANFLDWVTTNHDPKLVQKLNAAGRAGAYREELWKGATGKTVEELGTEWRRFHEQRLRPPEASKD